MFCHKLYALVLLVIITCLFIPRKEVFLKQKELETSISFYKAFIKLNGREFTYKKTYYYLNRNARILHSIVGSELTFYVKSNLTKVANHLEFTNLMPFEVKCGQNEILKPACEYEFTMTLHDIYKNLYEYLYDGI